MKYEDYIKLGFERTDMNDSDVLAQTGYGGFYLIKEVTPKLSIEVYSDDLSDPRLLIHKKVEGSVHRVKITPEQVRDLLA